MAAASAEILLVRGKELAAFFVKRCLEMAHTWHIPGQVWEVIEFEWQVPRPQIQKSHRGKDAA